MTCNFELLLTSSSVNILHSLAKYNSSTKQKPMFCFSFHQNSLVSFTEILDSRKKMNN